MDSASSSRQRFMQPGSPLAALMASSEASLRNMQANANQMKEEEHIAKGRCSFCGGKDGGSVSLKSCSRCKAARYCNETCQLADYKARHKRECANFVHPPTTGAFLIKPIANERYPQHPVFAHGHDDGVGCWVSIQGRIDCDLEALAQDIRVTGESSFEKRQKRIFADPQQGRDVVRAHKATAHSLLGLRVLVQNRRKDADPIIVVGSRAQVVSYGSTASAMMGGTAQGDNIAKFTRDRVPYVAAGVAIDPWDKCARLEITHMNGQEVGYDKNALSASIKDVKDGIVSLHPGDYVIFHLQFRVGDGGPICKDWEALGCLETIRIPYAPWNGAVAPSALITSLPLAHTPVPATGTGRSLRARFDQRAVQAYFADFIEHGEEAYMRSHFGDERADMAQNIDDVMTKLSEAFLGTVAQAGTTDVLVQHLHGIGMHEAADRIAARGQ